MTRFPLDFGFTLDPFQEDAIAALDRGESVLVCAPTGTGKTVIADHMVAGALARGEEVVYTAPIKALSNQKFRDYSRLHGEENVGLVTGDLVIRRDAPCRVMTTEILRNMLLLGEPLGRLRRVILDEIHFLDDRERGTAWEELLIYLPPEVQVLGLSATLSNARDFAAWLSEVRGQRVRVIHETHRAVPLVLQLFNRQAGAVDLEAYDRAFRRWRPKGPPPAHRRRVHGYSRRPARERPTTHLDVFRRLPPSYRPYLYFVFSRRNAERFARQLARRNPRLLDARELARAREMLDAFSREHGPRLLDSGLREMLLSGVAFHHAGLHVHLKSLVERLYERRLVKVLYCTSTFALGVNMPARSAVFDSLEKYDGRAIAPLSVREFMQMAGRAGRRGMDELGHVVVKLDFHDYENVRRQLSRYRADRPEPVTSSFGLSFNSVVNLLDRHPLERIRALLDRSFLSYYQRKRASRALQRAHRLEERLRRALSLPGDAHLPEPGELPPPLRRDAREARRLRSEARELESRVWRDFEARYRFLQRVGYLDEDLSLGAGARVVAQVQISEVFFAELFLGGLLDELSPEQLFGVLCAMVHDLPRGAAVREKPSGQYRRLLKNIGKVHRGPVVREADRITGLETSWCPSMAVFGLHWAEGRSMEEILLLLDSPIDVAGDLVGAFRRARDLLGQAIPLFAELDPARGQALRALLRSTARDEVEVVG